MILKLSSKLKHTLSALVCAIILLTFCIISLGFVSSKTVFSVTEFRDQKSSVAMLEKRRLDEIEKTRHLKQSLPWETGQETIEIILESGTPEILLTNFQENAPSSHFAQAPTTHPINNAVQRNRIFLNLHGNHEELSSSLNQIANLKGRVQNFNLSKKNETFHLTVQLHTYSTPYPILRKRRDYE